ncbi:helix-turn-helix transcriptional regulator [Paenibacillus sp. W4I10]|uniref:helix-turn-helix domain-containing protein n=1 Tax=Paenibacillus TaxID=44249 RepID=UPI00277F5432|nr:helix-turn-helix transcriptional regulator [Paenibacillus sp. W4I10]MDQ0723092.1 transcriptional regulator with XRE-family HTH domain [Paenibacillus sp. W4I10]
MEPTTTIRSYIEDYIRKQGYTLQYFADISGVNAGTLSAIIKGTRPIAMAQLDLITQGMKLEEGYFYEIYGAECFVESAPHWRRLEPFLQRCAELDKLECIHKVIQEVTDDRSYISELFEMAEGMLERGQTKAARMLYECVAECEKYQHSERLALCQYRIFTLSLGQDQHENLRAAVHFEPYINRLDEERQLDAIKDLANTYASLRYWDKLFSLADELGHKVEIIQSFTKKIVNKENRITAYPLFVYQAYSNLLKANACECRGEYTEALNYTKKYNDLVNISNPSDEDMIYINMFNRWTEVNTYLYNLMMGKKEVLPVYVAWIEQNEEETLTALVKIIEAANKYDMDIDDILLKFDNSINSMLSDRSLSEGYNEQLKNDLYSKLLFELAMYYFNRERYGEGMKKLVNCLSSAIRINNSNDIIQCVALFERYRSFASQEIKSTYHNLMEEVNSYYEIKKNHGYTLV